MTHFPTGIVSIVSDSYDIWNACENVWGQQLKSLVEKRDGTLVIRPDSGEPTEVVVKVTYVKMKSFNGMKTYFKNKIMSCSEMNDQLYGGYAFKNELQSRR